MVKMCDARRTFVDSRLAFYWEIFVLPNAVLQDPEILAALLVYALTSSYKYFLHFSKTPRYLKDKITISFFEKKKN